MFDFDCLTNVNGLTQSTVLGLQAGALYAVIAIGYTLVYGVLELINFAHSEIFMVGGFAAVFSAAAMAGDGTPAGIGIVGILLASLLVGMIAAAFMAVLMERVAYRPLRKSGAPRLAALISAIGVSLVISNAARVRYGADDIQFPGVLKTEILFRLGNVSVNNKQVLAVISAIVLLVVLDYFVNRTKTGKGIRAVAQDAETAGLMGVNIDRIIAITFLVGGLLGGAAGMIHAVVFGNISFNMGFIPGLKAFTAAVLGGIGNIRGAMLGGLLLGLFENYGALCVEQGARWKDVLAFSVLVLVLMVRPTGIMGAKVAERA